MRLRRPVRTPLPLSRLVPCRPGSMALIGANHQLVLLAPWLLGFLASLLSASLPCPPPIPPPFDANANDCLGKKLGFEEDRQEHQLHRIVYAEGGWQGGSQSPNLISSIWHLCMQVQTVHTGVYTRIWKRYWIAGQAGRQTDNRMG